MFRDVPECSGMFRVPGFIGGPGMDKSSAAKCILYSDVVKGEPSPTGR